MPTATLHYETARHAQQLFNNDPKNLKLLEEQLGVRATSREGWIKLEGEEPDIERARQVLIFLENSIKAGAAVRNREFAQALSVARQDGVEALHSLNQRSIQTSPRKLSVTPKTVGQRRYLDVITECDVTLGVGPAGTGKTYLAVAMAVAALREEKVSRIVLTRPAIEAGEALGFLPGDLFEKIAPYLRPLQDALHDMISPEEVIKLRERGVIEIAPLAYMRGRTLNQSFIILDEAQNTTAEQMLMFLTRLGHGSKAVVTGDPTQIDLPGSKRSGLLEALRVLRRVQGVGIVEFEKRDVVRHALVQRIISAYEEHRAELKHEVAASGKSPEGVPNRA